MSMTPIPLQAWAKSMDAWSWCSLVTSGSTLDFNFFIFAFFSSLYCKGAVGNTLNSFFKILAWSFQCLWSGLWPAADHNGKSYAPGTAEHSKANTPLAGGFFGILFAIKGDLDYYAKVLRLPWYTSSRPCALCACNSSDVPWTDFAHDALWRATRWNTTQWAATHPSGHPLLLGAFGCGIMSVCADLMHVKHMGTDSWFFGSVLQLLVYRVMGGTPAANLSAAWAAMLRDQKARGSKQDA